MSNDTQTELQVLKAEADSLGLEYSPNIGLGTLQTRIQEHHQNIINSQQEAAKPKALTEAETRQLKMRQANELVRVQVICMNSEKHNRQGEIFQAGNSIVGTLKKFVPYGVPWFVPRIIFNVIAEKKFQQRYGVGNLQTRMVKEYAIEELPPLTISEVEELKRQQALKAEAQNL